jgi:hypothetical protein
MAIAFISSSVASSGSSVTSLLVTKPAGVVDGNFLIAFVTITGDNTVNSVPAGWDLVDTQTSGTGTGDTRQYVYEKFASGEGLNYTWGFTLASDAAITILAYSDVHATTPVHAFGHTLMSSSTVTMSAPSVTPTVANTQTLVAFGTNPQFVGNTTFTTPPAAGVGGAITYIGGESHATPKGLNSITIDVPAGIAAGDVLVANLHSDYTRIDHDPPPGWVLGSWREEDYGSNVESNDPPLTGGKDLCGYFFYKVADGTETSITFQYDSLTDASRMAGGVVSAWRGVDTSSPIYDYEVNGQTSGNQCDCPSIDGVDGGALICAFHLDDKFPFDDVSGMTTIDKFEVPEPGTDDYMMVTYKLLTTTGATGIKVATYTDTDEGGGGDDNDMGWSISLRPLAGMAPRAEADPEGSTTNRAVLAVFDLPNAGATATGVKTSTLNNSAKGVGYTIVLQATGAPGQVVVITPETPTAITEGCMLGFYDGGNDWDDAKARATEMGTEWAIFRLYHAPPDFPTIKENTIEEVIADGKIPMVSHKPPKRSNAWLEIHQNQHEASIDAWVAYYKSLAPAQIIFVFHHEPHDNCKDLKPEKGLEGDAADFVKAYRYIGQKFRDANADNVLLGYCAVLGTWANKKASGSSVVGSGDKCWPGSDLVDVLCHDEYNSVGANHSPDPGNFADFTGSSWHSFQEEFEDAVILAKRLNKPIILGEIGSNHSTPLGDRGDWFRDGADWLTGDEDARAYFKGFCYYHVDNHDGSGHWWRFTSDSGTMFKGDGKQGFIDAFVSDPYFKSEPFDVLTENPVTSAVQGHGITTGEAFGLATVTMASGTQTIFQAGAITSPSDYDTVEEEAGQEFGTATITFTDAPLSVTDAGGIASGESFGGATVLKETGFGWIFNPPIRHNNPSLLPTTSKYKRALFKFYRGAPVGHNVYIMNDGSVTEFPDPLEIASTYHGGHSHVITDEEEVVLRAAGYGEFLTIIL